MDPELQQRFALIEEKVDKIYISVEKTRKYFLWTMIISVVLFVVPLIGLVFAIPYFLSSYVDPIQSLTNLTN
jgi:hypothetical protein